MEFVAGIVTRGLARVRCGVGTAACDFAKRISSRPFNGGNNMDDMKQMMIEAGNFHRE
jgi:hypothetical protein